MLHKICTVFVLLFTAEMCFSQPLVVSFHKSYETLSCTCNRHMMSSQCVSPCD